MSTKLMTVIERSNASNLAQYLGGLFNGSSIMGACPMIGCTEEFMGEYAEVANAYLTHAETEHGIKYASVEAMIQTISAGFVSLVEVKVDAEKGIVEQPNEKRRKASGSKKGKTVEETEVISREELVAMVPPMIVDPETPKAKKEKKSWVCPNCGEDLKGGKAFGKHVSRCKPAVVEPGDVVREDVCALVPDMVHPVRDFSEYAEALDVIARVESPKPVAAPVPVVVVDEPTPTLAETRKLLEELANTMKQTYSARKNLRAETINARIAEERRVYEYYRDVEDMAEMVSIARENLAMLRELGDEFWTPEEDATAKSQVARLTKHFISHRGSEDYAKGKSLAAKWAPVYAQEIQKVQQAEKEASMSDWQHAEVKAEAWKKENRKLLKDLEVGRLRYAANPRKNGGAERITMLVEFYWEVNRALAGLGSKPNRTQITDLKADVLSAMLDSVCETESVVRVGDVEIKASVLAEKKALFDVIMKQSEKLHALWISLNKGETKWCAWDIVVDRKADIGVVLLDEADPQVFLDPHGFSAKRGGYRASNVSDKDAKEGVVYRLTSDDDMPQAGIHNLPTLGAEIYQKFFSDPSKDVIEADEPKPNRRGGGRNRK